MSETGGSPPPRPPVRSRTDAAAAAAARRRRIATAVGGALIAIAAVVGVILLINVLNGDDKGSPQATSTASPGTSASPATGATPGSSATPGTGTPGGSPSGKPAASATSGAGGKASSTPTPPSRGVSPGGSGSGSGSGSGTGAGGSDGTTDVSAAQLRPVIVYNDSKIEGLGGKAADKVRAAGFRVPRVNGLRARVAVTTVYYDPPDQAAAQELILRVPGIARALPRPSWLLETHTLLLVVTRDFPV